MNYHVLFLCLAMMSTAAHAESKNANYQKSVQTLAPLPQAQPVMPDSMSEAEYAKVIKSQETKRKAISGKHDADFYEAKMSPQYKKFREEFLKIKTAEDLDQKLTELEESYDKLPASATDLKFVAAQIIPFRTMRGIVWRLIPPIQASKVTHSVILTQIKNMAVGIKIYLPTEQWSATTDYLSQPFVQNGVAPFSEKGKMVAQFPDHKEARASGTSSEAAIQAYFISAVLPALEKAAERIEKLDMSKGLYVWDNKFLYGASSFKDAIDRYTLMAEVERRTALSSLYSMLSQGYTVAAYSWDGLLGLISEVAGLYGFDGFLKDVDGVPAEKRVAILRKFPQWGLLMTENGYGQKMLDRAWQHLTKSVYHGDKAWMALKKREVGEVYLISSNLSLPFQRSIQSSYDNLKAMIKGPAKIHSVVTGQSVLVDLPAWYKNPPMDLKKLFGVEFDRSEEYVSTKTVEFGGSKIQLPAFRNYLKGRAIGWNLKEYQTLFPEAKTNPQLLEANRVLSQAWGGSLISMPLSVYMN